MKNGLKVAVVGATGAVGRELLSTLRDRKFPISELLLFASQRSDGKMIQFADKSYRCQTLKKGCFQDVQIAFFDASDAVSKEWVPHAAESGAWAVDNSAAFRLDQEIPLIVPEVNGELLAQARNRIIAGPNCSTVQMVVALKPIRDRWGLRRVVVSTYQSASGAGTAAMEELSAQAMGVFNQKTVAPKHFTHQLAFNCIPHIGGFKEDGYTSEEQKMMAEARKILGMPELKITATAVRVPTFSCHAESINVECEKPFQLDEVRKAIAEQSGVILQDEPSRNTYPMGMPGDASSVEGATGRDAVYVGRIRRDPSVENGLNLWVVSDNLRKGAALNAIQIGEILVQRLS